MSFSNTRQATVHNGGFSKEWKPYKPEIDLNSDLSPKILFISHMFPRADTPELGGFVFEQAKALRESGVDARVVTLSRHWIVRTIDYGVPGALAFSFRHYKEYLNNHNASVWMEYKGVPAIWLPYPLLFNDKWNSELYTSSVKRASEKIRDGFKFDIVHAHSAYLDGSAANWLSQRFRTPMVITEHSSQFTGLMSRKPARSAILGNLNKASTVIVVSNAQKKIIESTCGDDFSGNVTVVPNLVDTDIFYPTQVFFNNLDSPRFMFIGHFAPVKNLELLLKAFKKTLATFPKATLKIIGSDVRPDLVYENSLKALTVELGLGASVKFRPSIPITQRERLANYIRDECDILVLSSRSETFGCILIEAMACGKPVVSTRCGGPEEIITNRDVGLLCDNNSVDALAKALNNIAERLGKFNRAVIVESALRFAKPVVASALIKLYQKEIAESSSK